MITLDGALEAVETYLQSPRAGVCGEEARLGILVNKLVGLASARRPELARKLGIKLYGPEDVKYLEKLTAWLRTKRGVKERPESIIRWGRAVEMGRGRKGRKKLSFRSEVGLKGGMQA